MGPRRLRRLWLGSRSTSRGVRVARSPGRLTAPAPFRLARCSWMGAAASFPRAATAFTTRLLRPVRSPTACSPTPRSMHWSAWIRVAITTSTCSTRHSSPVCSAWEQAFARPSVPSATPELIPLAERITVQFTESQSMAFGRWSYTGRETMSSACWRRPSRSRSIFGADRRACAAGIRTPRSGCVVGGSRSCRQWHVRRHRCGAQSVRGIARDLGSLKGGLAFAPSRLPTERAGRGQGDEVPRSPGVASAGPCPGSA